MKRSLKVFRTAILAMVAMVFMAGAALAAMPDWENNVITVEGTGVAPLNAKYAGQGRMLARRAAVVDGYRQLAESINGVNVTSDTTVEQMMVSSDVIRTHVDGVIKGARILSERDLPGGGYSVTMQVSMFGVNSLADAVMERTTAAEPLPELSPDVEPSLPVTPEDLNSPTPLEDTSAPRDYSASAPSGVAIGVFTGVIVDCRGLGLNPVMSPVIKNENGQPIYGYKNLDCDLVVSKGMAGYATDMEQTNRAGNHPLYVKAVSLDNHNANPVLSVADANRVLLENSATGFLNSTNVVFLR